jgi:hypothetical protein
MNSKSVEFEINDFALLRGATVQHSGCLPPEHIQMAWLLGSLIGIAIAITWVSVEFLLARRKPLT